jgi:hydrogenase expression/formation protein HypE
MEATSILVKDFRHVFQKHLNSDDIKTAEDLMSQISVVPEGRIAARCNASACHDATEGGVLGAIYELAQASGKGATVWLEKIPVLPITKIVAEIAKVDPLRMVSSGCLVVCTKNGERLKSTYLSAGINAEVVGKITSGESRLIGYCKESPLEAPGPDELYKARAYLETISHPKG